MKKLLFFLCALFSAAPMYGVTCVAVAVSAAGSGNGTSWTNAKAYSTLSGTNWVRGNIYYLADGNYGTGGFDLSTPLSGTTTITVKKAQSYDYGRTTDGCTNDISSGWNAATMGSAQAVWSAPASGAANVGFFGTAGGYFIVNGNGQTTNPAVGCGNVQSNPPASMTAAPNSPSDCGIKWDDSTCTVTTNNGCDSGNGMIYGGGPGIQLLSMEIKGQGLNSNGNNNSETYQWFANGGNLTGVKIQHVYFHNASTTNFTVVAGGWEGGSFDHNYSWGIFDGSVNHGESVQLQGSNGQTTPNNIFSNIFRDQQTNGDVVAVITGTQTFNFYDNVDFCSSGGTSTTCRHNNGVIGCYNSQTCSNVKIYNNTFSFPSSCGWNVTGGPSTMTVENNLFFNCGSVGMTGGTNTVDYNSYLNSSQSAVGAHDVSATGVANPFVSLTTGNVNLTADSANYNSRLSLASPYDVDLYGNAFTTDRGAAQFVPSTLVIQGTNGTLGQAGTGYSINGYPHFVIPGSDTQNYVSVYAEIDSPTAWTNTSGNATFTVNNTFTAGDAVTIVGFNPAAAATSSGTTALIASATSTTATINGVGTSGSSGSITAGQLRKRSGAGFTPNGTWTITNTGTDASQTYKLYTQDGNSTTSFSTNPTLTSVAPFINLVVGPAKTGDCTTTGSLTAGTLAVTSPVMFDLTFTSAQDNSKSYTYKYVVCKEGGGYPYLGVAHATPGYQQLYKNVHVPLRGQVFGNTNQMIDWTIVSSPAGGDATISFPTFPEPVLNSGTVSGHYKIKACPHVDASTGACDFISFWVAAGSPPAANTDKVEQTPCELDTGITWGTTTQVGPTHALPDLSTLPQFTAGPWFIQVFNEGAGGSPTVYHQLLQLNQPSSGGPFTSDNPAIFLCGVANSTTGELPIIDNNLATMQSWMNINYVGSVGMIGFKPTSALVPNSGSQLPYNYVTLSGLHLLHAVSLPTNTYQFYNASGVLTNSSNYGFHASAGPQHYSVIGSFTDTVATPFFDSCNTNTGDWPFCVQDSYYRGNHLANYGTPGLSTSHPFYIQAWRTASYLNFEEGSDTGSSGQGCYFERPTTGAYSYNYCKASAGHSLASGTGAHGEIQDSTGYIVPDSFFGNQGAAQCTGGTPYASGQSPFCEGTYGGANWLASVIEEHNKTGFVVGNLFYVAQTGAVKYLGCVSTNGGNNMDAPDKCYSAYNNWAVDHVNSNGGSFGEDTRASSGATITGLNSNVIWPRLYTQNDIVYWNQNTTTPCPYNCVPFGTRGTIMLNFGKTLIATNQVTVASNIPALYGTGISVYHNGVAQNAGFYEYANIAPIEAHLGGWSSGNFIPASSLPYGANLVPGSGSPAISAASALTGELAYYPPRFNAVDPTNPGVYTLRTDLTTMGPYDPQGVPTLVSIAVTNNPSATVVGGSVQLTATGTYSDSSTANVTNACTWTGGGSFFHMSGVTQGLAIGDAVGSASATCTLSPASPAAATVNVSAAATNGSTVGAGVKMGYGGSVH